MISDWDRSRKVVKAKVEASFLIEKPFSRFLAIAISRGPESTRAAWTFFRRSLKEINLETQAQPAFHVSEHKLVGRERFSTILICELRACASTKELRNCTTWSHRSHFATFSRCFAFLSARGSAGKKAGKSSLIIRKTHGRLDGIVQPIMHISLQL